MAGVLIVYDKKKQMKYESILKQMRDIFVEERMQVELLGLDGEGQSNQDAAWLREHGGSYAYVCSLDMAGFQFGTLLGGVLYNLLPALQIHIILDVKVLDKYAGISCALNLFFFVQSERDLELPFSVLNYSSFLLPDRQTLASIIHSVIQENGTTA